MPIYIPFLCLAVSTSPILHIAKLKGGDRKYKQGKPRRKRRNSFGASLLPCLGSAYLIKYLSARVELTCNLSIVLNPYSNIPNFCCDKIRNKEDKLTKLAFLCGELAKEEHRWGSMMETEQHAPVNWYIPSTWWCKRDLVSPLKTKLRINIPFWDMMSDNLSIYISGNIKWKLKK